MPVKLKLGTILTLLMRECGVDDATLSRETEIPASSISRLRTNPHANPTASTLSPIANYFDVSISQLIGDRPLPENRIPGTYQQNERVSVGVPLLNWEFVTDWFQPNFAHKEKLREMIFTDKSVSEKAFALMVNTDSFGLAFRSGTIIVVDPELTPRDGDFIILSNEDKPGVLLRQLLIDGDELFLKTANPELKNIKQISCLPECSGVIIEARYTFKGNRINNDRVSQANLLTQLA